MDDKRSKVFNAHQGKFGSQWLNVVPCKNLGLKLELRISIGLRLGANICVAHTCPCGKRVERDVLHGLSCGNRTFRQKRFGKKNRDVSGNFFCRNVRCHVFAETSFAETSCSPLGYVPISSSAPRPLGAAYMPILLSEVEQEQRPSGNGDREAIVVGAGLCDGEGERAYIAYIMLDVSANILA